MLPKVIKAFNIDFNWDSIYQPAAPGLYAHADPGEQVRWMADLGANVIQAFCVSFNGQAWFPSETAPINPGLGDFLPRLIQEASKKNMAVMGYFDIGQNRTWELENQKVIRFSLTDMVHIPYTRAYLDFFASCIRDALRKTDVEGFMVDTFRPMIKDVWLDCMKEMYVELMGEPFPACGTLPEDVSLEFDRRSLTRAWQYTRDAVADVRPAVIWPNPPFRGPDDPLWTGHILPRESGWLLNEGPDVELLDWLSRQIGPQTKIIQNLCGWPGHDANMWRTIDRKKYGLYGFAQAHPLTCLPADHGSNLKNIEIIRQAYHAPDDLPAAQGGF
ncbi:MAG: hypothetical protein IT440_02025 [Phycisphaeraceae bacterium]|nr:hypothetical protein [Phycisphaeraceae bacterium]